MNADEDAPDGAGDEVELKSLRSAVSSNSNIFRFNFFLSGNKVEVGMISLLSTDRTFVLSFCQDVCLYHVYPFLGLQKKIMLLVISSGLGG